MEVLKGITDIGGGSPHRDDRRPEVHRVAVPCPSRNKQDCAKEERHVGKPGEVPHMHGASYEIAGVRAKNARCDESQPVVRIDPGDISHVYVPCKADTRAQVRQRLVSCLREREWAETTSPWPKRT